MSNYIVLGYSRLESRVLREQISSRGDKSIIRVNDSSGLKKAFDVIRYKPFFYDKWFVIVDAKTLRKKDILSCFSLISKNAEIYLRLTDNKLYYAFSKSEVLREREDIYFLNAKYPDDTYLTNYLLKEVNKYFNRDVIKYIIKNIRFRLDELDTVVERMNFHTLDEITLDDIKKILPHRRSESLREYVYMLMLASREDVQNNWRSSKVAAFANKKRRPYEILESVNLKPKSILNIIVSTLDNLNLVKLLWLNGTLTNTNVFNEKSKLETKYPKLKNVNIPTIIEMLEVSNEVSRAEIVYIKDKFLKLKMEPEVTLEQLLHTTYLVMRRNEL